MGFFKELEINQKCPCGSGKTYGECCKKKAFEYGFEGKQLVKHMHMKSEVNDILQEYKKQFLEYYGREPGKEEFVDAFSPIYNDKTLLYSTDLLRKLGFPEEKIYAYYKSDGLLPCDLNIDLLSETELEEFAALCEEYEALMSEEADESVNAVCFVEVGNRFVGEHVEYAVNALIHTFNDFIHRHSNTNRIREYQIRTEVDYCIFSALKTIKTLESVMKLKEEYLTECIYALSRSIFENYLYLCNININPSLFEENILPKVDEEKYMFEVYQDGHVNYNKVIERKTGNKKSIKIQISDLKEKLPYDTDKELYEVFYRNVYHYVHVDIMSAKSYFSTYDPYDEINPSIIAVLITVILAMLLLLQISKNAGTQFLYQKDAYNLCRHLKNRFIQCLEFINSDIDHSNVVYGLLLKRLKEEII